MALTQGGRTQTATKVRSMKKGGTGKGAAFESTINASQSSYDGCQT